MTINEQGRTHRYSRAAFFALTPLFALGTLVLLAGCGGSSLSNAVARIRAIDTCPNGGVATIYINLGSANGSQTFGQSSPYLFIGSGTTQLTFTLSSYSTTTYEVINENIVEGNFYTVTLVGRPDVAPTDIFGRYPKLVFTLDDQTIPPAGDARLRFLQAAPDGGSVDIYVNGHLTETNIPYAAYTQYVNVPVGQEAIQFDKAGTSTPLVSPQTVTVQSGLLYSVMSLEPTVTPPTYQIVSLNNPL